MSTYTPYFYIIREVSTGKKYAGCRYAKGCYPSELLQINGYHTSSNIIKSIIARDGVSAFTIIQLITESACGIPVLEYETRFLQYFNIAAREDWYNGHNNTLFSYYSDQYKDTMVKLYGTVVPMHSPIILERFKQTNLERYGSEYFLGTEDWREKTTATLMDRYGVEHNSQIPGMTERKIKTNQERTGFDFPMQNPETKIKSVATFIARSHEEKLQSKEKSKNTNLVRYGVDHWTKTDAGRAQGSKKMQDCNNTVHFCSYCDQYIKGPNYKRWHGENCKENPNSHKSRKQPVFECEFCHGSYPKHILAQNHGKYCKDNPDREIKPKPKQRPKYKCECCGVEIDSANYKRHIKRCSSS